MASERLTQPSRIHYTWQASEPHPGVPGANQPETRGFGYFAYCVGFASNFALHPFEQK
jgi:hypothetical protein